MRGLASWQTALVTSWSQVWASILGIIPVILGAIVIFVIGLVIAYWVKKLIVEFLRLLQVQKLSESLGIDEFLKKAEMKTDLTEILAVFAQWLIILVFFLASVDILGLNAVSSVLTKVLSYIPNILAAALIFGAGYFAAGLVESLVRGALVSVDHDIAKPIGKFARWILLVVTFFAAIDQLQIAQSLISTFFQGLTYTIVLVVGLSVGLGAKDVIAKILNDWYEKIKK
jgi:hypothetical protein